MLDQFTFGLPFLTGSLALVVLLIVWYRRVDPLVGFHLALQHIPRVAYIRLISPARCYSSDRI